MMRPGISDEMLTRAGVQHVSADEAKALCNEAMAGLWLPYRHADGSAIRDGEKDYGRLRLDQPKDKKKYHQAAGTTVHAYLPPMAADATSVGGDLFIIEGEFKSLSLTEAGFPAVGISGFYGFGLKDGKGLVPELAAVIQRRKPDRILFCGDSDTALNYFFPLAAVRLANLVQPVKVFLPRIPLDGPGKGADDCRAKLNGTFDGWWRERIVQAIEVNTDTDPKLLMLELFEREQSAMINLTGKARKEVEDRLVKLAAAFHKHPIDQERVLNFAVKKLGLGRSGVAKAVEAEIKAQAARRAQPAEQATGRTIEHREPAAIWTRQVWESIADSVYWYAGHLCRLHGDQLKQQTAAEMVSFLDDPTRCCFQGRDRNGEAVMSTVTEADARVFLGSWMNSPDLIRHVDVFSNLPVLAWDGQKPVLVNKYDRDLRILAHGDELTLPTPKEAVEILVRLLGDYDFGTNGDLGRAIALLLSPALAQGGFLGKGRVPLFLIEKNEASAGGSLLLRLACQIYGLKPKPISKLDNRDRVVEDISRLLLSGAGFIYFDNARGRGLQNLPELESLLTEPIFNCRAPYLHGEADVTRRVLAVSSNGAVFSHDLASRTAKISIRKRPADYAFADYAEGSIEDHVAANMGLYLGAVFRLVRDWADLGRPAGSQLTGFRFPQWERACAWILQKHFPGLPLLDASHREAQERLADPDHDLMRNLFRLVVEGETRGELTASSLAEIGLEAGLLEGDEQQNRLRMGKIMKRRFPNDGEHTFDSGNYTVMRDTRRSTSGNGHDVAFYEIHAGEKKP
jgi:predicted transcriptional regulator